ncbi:hypothetical protein JW979_02965, partial [bacterium]|nr:hypothetical protein [candidate division CSSED10-310 bacterium]
MTLVNDSFELTTAVTDLLLGFIALICAGLIFRLGHLMTVKRYIWSLVFLMLATGAVIGSAAHGLILNDQIQRILWIGIYISLGQTVSLLIAATIIDWINERVALISL